MSKHSNTRFLVEYALIALASYLILSALIAIIGGYNYREILTSDNQWAAAIFIYPYIPIPRMIDMGDHNDLV